jgi:ketosteroid isomerase-like protein
MAEHPNVARIRDGYAAFAKGDFATLTEGSFHLDLHTVFADDEHGVALVATSASRGGKSVRINEAHIYHLRDGKVTEFWDASTDEYALDELIGG